MTKETNIPPFGEEGFKLFQQFTPFTQFKFPGADMETLLASYKSNIELLTAIQQIASESTKAIMQLQNEYAKKAFDQWNEQIKCYCSQNPLEEKLDPQSKTAKAAVNQTIEHAQKLNSIIAQSSKKIIGSVQTHFKEGLKDSLDPAKRERKRD